MNAGALGLLALALVLPGRPPTSDDAETLWERGERLRALDVAARELAERPDDLALRTQLASWQMTTHRYAAALETAEGAPVPLAALRGQALYLLGRYAEALELLDASDPLATLMRVDAHVVLGHDEETWAALQDAVAVLGEDHAQLLAVRGRLLARAGSHAEAEQAFAAALASDPYEIGALFGRGQALVRLGRRDAGLALLEEHRRLVPLMDRLDAARQAVDMGPLHAPNLAALGDAERELGRSDRAVDAYRRAVELARPEELAPIALREARLLDELGQLDLAVQRLGAAGLRSADARLPVRAGDLLGAAGRWAEAVQHFERAAALRPDDAVIAARLAAAREAAR